MNEFELIAKTFMGLEPVLAKELIQMGANNVKTGRRMVSFTGDKEMMYRANFQLHTAIRILKPISHFKARSADDVYNEVKKIDWSGIIEKGKTFSVDSVVYSEEFRNSRFVTYKVKDAIVDQFRENTGTRPNISVSNPDIRLNIHIAEDNATLSLDFNKRLGTVAAGLLLEGFYTRLHNPFRNEIGDMQPDGTVVYTRINATSGATVAGVNVELKLVPLSSLQIAGGFTWQSSRYGEPDDTFGRREFFRTPSNYGFLTLDWDFARRFCLSVNGNYTGRMLVPYFGPTLAQPEAGELRTSRPFFDLGAKLAYDLPLGSGVVAQFYTGVKNAFNSYQDDFDRGVDRDPSYIYGPALPRTVFAGLKVSL